MEQVSKKVIISVTDFTPIGQYSVDNAAEFTKLIKGKLMVLHVVTKDTKAKLRKEKKCTKTLDECMQQICNKVQEDYGIEASYVLPEGNIFDTLGSTASTLNADFVFMGIHGKKGIEFLVGGNAIKVITRCSVPIFVVHKPASGKDFKNFIYPLDSCPGAKQKIKIAMELQKITGTTFHFFVYMPENDPNVNRTKAAWSQIEKILKDHNATYTIEKYTKLNGFENAVVALAKNINADAIILNTDPEKFTWSPLQLPEEKIIYNKEGITVLCVNAKNMNRIVGGL